MKYGLTVALFKIVLIEYEQEQIRVNIFYGSRKLMFL